MSSQAKRSRVEMQENNDNNNIVKYETRAVFKVKKFTEKLQKTGPKVSKQLKSDIFSIVDNEWQILIEWKDEEFVGLFLVMTNDINNNSNNKKKKKDLPVVVVFKMSIIDGKDTVIEGLAIEKAFDERANSWGYPQFITKTELTDNKDKYLPDLSLTIAVDITVHKKSTISNHSLLLLRSCGEKQFCRFAHLLGVRELSDCQLIVGKDRKVFYASKLVLSSKSVVFEKMFTIDCLEKTNSEVIIDDIHSNVFEEFLHYLYTEKSDKLVEMCEQMLYLADKYMIDQLKTICLNLVYLRINGNNAMDIWLTLKKFRANEQLLQNVSQFIGENLVPVITREFIANYGFQSQDITEIINNIGKHWPKTKPKLMFYTYSFN